jgi:hypothetical protein
MVGFAEGPMTPEWPCEWHVLCVREPQKDGTMLYWIVVIIVILLILGIVFGRRRGR